MSVKSIRWVLFGFLAVFLLSGFQLRMKSSVKNKLVISPSRSAVCAKLEQQAIWFESRGDISAASRSAEMALKIAKEEFGPAHAKTAELMEYLGKLYDEQGKTSKAEKLRKQMLPGIEQSRMIPAIDPVV